MRHLCATATLLALATPAMAEPDYAAAVKADYDRDLKGLWDWFHRNPELSFKEDSAVQRPDKSERSGCG